MTIKFASELYLELKSKPISNNERRSESAFVQNISKPEAEFVLNQDLAPTSKSSSFKNDEFA